MTLKLKGKKLFKAMRSRLDRLKFIMGENIMKLLSYLKDKGRFLIAFVVRRFFCTITYAVWLDRNNKIAGWKVKFGDINHFTSNVMNYFPYRFDEVYLKKKNIFVPKINIITNAVFKNSNKWYRQWDHSSLFKGFRAY